MDRGGRVGVEWEDLGGEEKLTIAFVDRRRQVGLLARKHGRIIYETLKTFWEIELFVGRFTLALSRGNLLLNSGN